MKCKPGRTGARRKDKSRKAYTDEAKVLVGRLQAFLQRYWSLRFLHITGETDQLDISKHLRECVVQIWSLCRSLRQSFPRKIREIQREIRDVERKYPLLRFPDTIFAAMPFEKGFDPVWIKAVRRMCRYKRYKPFRADSLKMAEDICNRVAARIRNCRAVVADVTGGNPNVMFEVGCAFMGDKPVLLLTRSPSETMPVILQGKDTTCYNKGNKAMRALREAIGTFLSQIRGEENGFTSLFCGRT